MVSVIVPAFNTAHYIGETLDSVFAQSFTDFEVLVVNDGSPDTPQLENVLVPYLSRIRYLKQDNRGLAAARNTGIRNAGGDFLIFLDSDDVWLPDFLSEQMKFFAENPAIDMVCADCVYFGETELAGKSWQSLNPMEPPITFEKILPTHGGAFSSFAVLRSEIVRKVGFFDEQRGVLEDYQYWLRLLHCGGKLAYLPKVLGKRRVHSTSVTSNQDVVVPMAINALLRFKQTLDPATPEAVLVGREIALAKSRQALKEGRVRLATRDYTGARRSFREANAIIPSQKVRLTLLGLSVAPQWTRWAVCRWDERGKKSSLRP